MATSKHSHRQHYYGYETIHKNRMMIRLCWIALAILVGILFVIGE